MAKTVHEEEYRLIDRVSAGFANIADGLKGLKTRFTELNQGAELASKGIALVRDGAESIGDTVSGAANLEEALRRVSIRTRATADEQVELQAAVRAAADTVGATADEAAAALLNMANDGYSARDAIDNLGTVLAYAKGQAKGTAEAAAGLGGILDSFGERAINSVGQVADALTATAQAAGTTTDTLEKGLSSLGVTAQENNLVFTETVGLLGLLAKRNIEGSDAAKRLATILDQFRDPASQARQALADLGLSGADFSTVLQTLSTDSAAATTVLESLGRKPREALLALLADGGAALTEMNRIIGESEGASQRAADALRGTFNDSLQRVVAQIDVLKNAAAGEVLAPLSEGLTVLADRLSDLANSPEFAGAAAQFGKLAGEGIKEIAKFIETFDFESAKQNIEQFYADSKIIFDGLATAAGLAADAIRLIGEAYKTLSEQSDALAEFLGVNEKFSEGISKNNKVLSELRERVNAAKSAARLYTDETDRATGSTDAFGFSLDQIGTAATELEANFRRVPPAIKLIEVNSQSLEKTLAKTNAELEKARKAYQAAFDNGSGVDEAWADVQRLGTSVANLRKLLDEVEGKTYDAVEAFKELGFQSEKLLKESAEKGAAAFNAIVEAARKGEAAQSDVARAFEEYARRLVATAEYADESTKRQIAQQIELAGRIAGVSYELINVATSSLKAADAAEQSGERIAKSFDGARGSAAAVSESIDDASGSATQFGNIGVRAATAVATANEQTAASYDAIGGRIDAVTQATSQQARAALESALELNRGNAAVVESLNAQLDAINGLTEARKRALEIARQEQAAVEETLRLQAAAVSGGLGYNNPQAGAAAAPATGSTSRAATTVAPVINVYGLPTDREGQRRFVADVIVPELARLARLSR